MIVEMVYLEQPSTGFEQANNISEILRSVEHIVQGRAAYDELGAAFHVARDRLAEIPDDTGALIGIDVDRMNVAHAEHTKEGALRDACFLLPLCFHCLGVEFDRYVGGSDAVAVHNGCRRLVVEPGEQATQSVHDRRKRPVAVLQHDQFAQVK